MEVVVILVVSNVLGYGFRRVRDGLVGCLVVIKVCGIILVLSVFIYLGEYCIRVFCRRIYLK